jgi:hypothetical protein
VIESIMYFGIGFLFAALFGLMIIPLVQGRAVRLTTRRLEAAIPSSIAEIQADKDQLRADFAMSTRRLEMIVEQLKGKSTSQLAELGRKGDVINLLKSERDAQTVEISALKSQVQALKERLRNAGNEVEVEGDFVPHLLKNRRTAKLIKVPMVSLQSPSPNDQRDFVLLVPKEWPTFRNVAAIIITALIAFGATLVSQANALIMRVPLPKGPRLPMWARDCGDYKLSAIEKETQIEKELVAASVRVEEMMRNIFNPKLLPLAMIGARAAVKCIPRPLAVGIARKIAASEDEPRIRDKLPTKDGLPIKTFRLMARREGPQKNALSFQGQERKDDPAIQLRKFFRLATLMTAAAVGGFALVWYLLSSPWPLVLTLRHFAAYPNCAATEMVGLAPATKGNPGYWSHNDPDGDGVACK